jgi:hypothetical protein
MKFVSALGDVSESERERERAQFIVQHGVRELVRYACRNDVPLWYVVTIAELPAESQHAALAAGLRVPESQALNSVDQILAAVATTSEGEDDRIIAAIEAKRAAKNRAGVLFPEVAAEIQDKEKRMAPTDEEFEKFYIEYPRRVNKKKAKVAFASAFKSLRKKHTPEEAIGIIMRGVAVYAKHANPDAICHPTTWLNGARWEDEPEGIGKPQTKPSSSSYGEYRELTPEEYAVF